VVKVKCRGTPRVAADSTRPPKIGHGSGSKLMTALRDLLLPLPGIHLFLDGVKEEDGPHPRLD
jgi:hypothetical protein